MKRFNKQQALWCLLWASPFIVLVVVMMKIAAGGAASAGGTIVTALWSSTLKVTTGTR